MAHYLGALLLAGFAAGILLSLYDQILTGPAWARTLLSVLLSLGPAYYIERDVDCVLLAAGAALVANLLVALLQLLQVQRDVAMTSVLRRTR